MSARVVNIISRLCRPSVTMRCYNLGGIPYQCIRTVEAYEGAIEMKRTLALILAILMALAAPAVGSSQAKKVLSVAKKQIGAPYKLDADSPKSFNCFSFVAYCFNEVSPGTITSSGINGPYDTVTSASKLKAGDIVIFRSNRKLKGIMGYH